MSKTKSVNSIKTSGKIFFWVMVALPLLQFAIFYVAVNFNSVLLAFKSYENFTGNIVTKWIWFENFESIFHEWRAGELLNMVVLNALKYMAIDIFIVMPVSVLFSYYIFKKFALSGVFKILIFLPNVVCIMVLVIFYKHFIEHGMAQLIYDLSGNYIESFFLDKRYAFPSLLLFYLMMGFAGNILIYLNAMSSVPKDVFEASMIDGASEAKTFWYIVIPSIYTTCVSLLIISIAGIGSNQAYIHAFYGSKGSPVYTRTLGYHLFNLVATSGSDGDNPTQYPIAAAYGLLVTVVVAPLTMIIKKLLIKYGPSED